MGGFLQVLGRTFGGTRFLDLDLKFALLTAVKPPMFRVLWKKIRGGGVGEWGSGGVGEWGVGKWGEWGVGSGEKQSNLIAIVVFI